MAPEEKGPDARPRSPLIKKGTVSYQPIPSLSDAPAEPRAASQKSPEKTVQVLKEHPPAGGTTSQPAENLAEPLTAQVEMLNRMREEAQKMIAKAKAEAEKLLAEAQTKSKKLIEESKLYARTSEENARREAYAEGKKEGYEAGVNELREIMESARDTLRQAVRMREDLEKSAERDLARLAIKIAERIIGSEVTLNHNVVINMVKANLERVKEREHVIIRVHPEDLEYVKNNRETFSKFVPEVRSMEVHGDPRVERGGCIVETNLGTVDARISTQLEAIAAAFSQIDETTQPKAEEPHPEEPHDP